MDVSKSYALEVRALRHSSLREFTIRLKDYPPNLVATGEFAVDETPVHLRPEPTLTWPPREPLPAEPTPPARGEQGIPEVRPRRVRLKYRGSAPIDFPEWDELYDVCLVGDELLLWGPVGDQS